MRWMSLIVFTACLSIGSAALAQTAEERAECKADVERLCKGIEPGGGRIVECLAKQKDKISVGCAKALEAYKK